MNDAQSNCVQSKVWLPDVVGKGYGRFWKFKGRYRVVKGSRASKKSKTTAINFITKLVEHPNANLLVVRKTFRTLSSSCFSDLRWAINRLHLTEYFNCTTSPLEIKYIPTGQVIYFRGLDDPLKIASISVPKGSLCWVWIEEAYEINETDFNFIDESIRGEVSDDLWKQITLTFNPWNEHSWLKKRFFDCPDNTDKLTITTTYECNEWLDDADRALFERMKIERPERYRVAGLGNWGSPEGTVFTRFKVDRFNLDVIRKKDKSLAAFGLDFGFTTDPTALFCGIICPDEKRIYVFDEMYEKGLINSKIAYKINQMGFQNEEIFADSSEPKSLEELRSDLTCPIRRIFGVKKGPDSVRNGIQCVQSYEIIINPLCVNFIREIENYCWAKNRAGELTGEPVDFDNHLMDAMRYAIMSLHSRVLLSSHDPSFSSADIY